MNTSKLGTYSTIDAPTNKEAEALAMLQYEFHKIGGKVRRVMNPHDFGMYPSFEVDYPEEIEDVDVDDEADEELAIKKDRWHDAANDIDARYCKRFSDYL